MKISLEWLQDWIDLTEKDPQKIADVITEATGEVEEVIVQGALLDHCCVGKILTLSKHPNADKLTLCDVKTDKGVKKIVCGGTNLREGMKVAVAHVGATVRWHGGEMMTLVKTKIRGEESEGMICAAEELEIQDMFPDATDHSIVDLGDGDDGVGKDLKTYLGLNDTVLHIDNHAITHRADLFSHKGFAREFVALGLGKWKKPSKHAPLKFTKSAVPFRFVNDIEKLVPRYAACTLSIDGLGDTPDWMKRRLAATGWRSVSLPVDITNYVSMELGMPLHSFDMGDLKGDVHIRLSKKNEKITTLDHVERVLPDGAIILSDKEGIFDLLGIMGGLRSSTKDSTRQIYLHSAAVDPVSIRKAIVATGHRTDAATVYEKGIPRSVVEPGLLRAIELMLELIPGASLTSKLETWGDDGKAPAIALPLERIAHVLGTEISEKKVEKIFADLEFTTKKKGDVLTVTPPLHRLGDIRGTHDLVEEVGRINGYNTIAPQIAMAPMVPPKRDHRMKWMREALRERGYFEILPLSLTGKDVLKKYGAPTDAVEIQNPLGAELGVLHTSTLPALLTHAEANYLIAGKTLRTFHWGTVFHTGKTIDQHAELSFLYTNLSSDSSLLAEPFLVAKQDLAHVLCAMGYDATVVPAKHVPTVAHPGRCATVQVAGKDVGLIYELSPAIRAVVNIPMAVGQRIAVCTLNLTHLLAESPVLALAKPIPAFPEVTFDENMELSQKDSIDALLSKMKAADPLLASVTIVDLYRGKDHGNDHYRATVRFTYRAPDRTLTSTDAETAHRKVFAVAGLKN